MSSLDIFLIGATVLWLLLSGLAGRWRWVGLALLAALAGVQFALEGFVWQLTPAYVLIPLAALLGLLPRLRRRWIAAGLRVVAALLVIAPWTAFPPVPALPQPTGPYAVGTEIFRWVDPERPETATADPNDRRNVIVQVWYPAVKGSRGKGAPYIDGLGHLPATVSVIPGFVMRGYGRIDTHAVAGAAVSEARVWPIVLFSPGYGAPRAAYTGLVTELASRGYVVMAIDHPYESAVTQLADGRIAANFAPHGDLTAYMVRQQDIRAADLAFVLDQLDHGAFGLRLPCHFDLTRIAAAGHSFGGASAVLAMSRDDRIKAAVNLDGTPYGDLPKTRLTRPFLLIQSDPSESPHGETFNIGNAELLAGDSAATGRVTIAHANHYSFTDAPLMLAPPARWASTLVAGGGLGAAATQQTAVDALDQFLKEKAGFSR